MSKDFAKDVKVNPGETLQLKAGGATEVSVENKGKRKLTYKLKTTRPASVKPTKAFGTVDSMATDTFKVNFKPTSSEKPFGDSDRMTILVGIMPDSFSNAEHYWKTPNAVSDAHRVVLKLEKSGEAKPAGKKKEASEKEEVASEESEAETESGTESGATESEA